MEVRGGMLEAERTALSGGLFEHRRDMQAGARLDPVASTIRLSRMGLPSRSFMKLLISRTHCKTDNQRATFAKSTFARYLRSVLATNNQQRSGRCV